MLCLFVAAVLLQPLLSVLSLVLTFITSLILAILSSLSFPKILSLIKYLWFQSFPVQEAFHDHHVTPFPTIAYSKSVGPVTFHFFHPSLSHLLSFPGVY